MARYSTIVLTAKQRLILRQCVRIASEDGSIWVLDPSGRVVAALNKKLED